MNSRSEIDKNDDSIKVNCHYCGVKILKDTARRTNGYCMPHSYFSEPFQEQIGGVFEIIEQITQQEVEKSLNNKYIKVFDVIKSIMIVDDKLVKFRAIPLVDQKKYATNGYAIIRNNNIYTGFVTNWKENPKFYEDVETEVSLSEIQQIFGADWEEIESKLIEGDQFIYYNSSPFSWDCLAGREYYCIKRGDEHLYTKLVAMN